MGTRIDVAIFADQLLYKQPGGLGRYILKLYHNFSRSVHPALMLCEGKLDRQVDNLIGGDTVRLPLKRAPLGALWHLARFPRLERITKAPFELLHCPSLVIPPTKRPMVVTIADLTVVRYPDYIPPKWRVFLKRGLDIAVREAEVLVCISNSVALELLEYHPQAADRIRVTHLGVDQPEEKPGPIRGEGEGSGSFTFLFVGTLEPRKNIENLARAFLELRGELKGMDLRLRLVGPYGWGVDRGLLRHDAVEWAGPTSEADLEREYALADAFVYPSYYEGFGLPVLEAMSWGLPVVASDIAAIGEVASGYALLVDPDDVSQLRSAMREMAEDPQLREELSEKGRRRSRDFTWENTALQTEEAYREAAASRSV